MTRNSFAWLIDWYRSQCDGDWEHQFGVTIDTLDNPGWSLTVDLEATALEYVPYEGKLHNLESGDEDQGRSGFVSWYVCRVSNKKFVGYGGPDNLEDLIKEFISMAAPI